MLPELTHDEFSAALDAVARSLLDALDVQAPPVNALQVAEAMGLSIAWDATQAGRGRTVRLGAFGGGVAQASILVRPEPRPERLQWTVAHEIGESCAAEVLHYLGVDPREAPPQTRESVANQLAGRLLLPRAWFGADGRECGWDLVELKARYATASHELIARRMLDFAPSIVVAVFDHGRRSWRKSNLAGRLPPFMPLEHAAWQQVHETSLPACEEAPACRVQAWPIHEPEWKREILRTEWFADEAAFAE